MPAQFEIYKDDAGEWRWRCRAANGKIVIPPESHRDPTDAERAIHDAAAAVVEATKFDYGETIYRVTTKE